MAEFDPDAYLAGGETVATADFDPDAYLKQKESGFDPDAYLAMPEPGPTPEGGGWSGIFSDAEQRTGLRPGLLSAIAQQENVNPKHNNPLGLSTDAGVMSFGPEEAAARVYRQAALLTNPNGPYRDFVQTGDLNDLAKVYSPVGAANDIHGTNSTEAQGIAAALGGPNISIGGPVPVSPENVDWESPEESSEVPAAPEAEPTLPPREAAQTPPQTAPAQPPPPPRSWFQPQSAAQVDAVDAKVARDYGPLLNIPQAEIKPDDHLGIKLNKAIYNTVTGFVGGMTSADGLNAVLNPVVGVATLGAMVPELVHQVREAEKTPPGSPERVQAGVNVASFVALPAVFHAVRAKPSEFRSQNNIKGGEQTYATQKQQTQTESGLQTLGESGTPPESPPRYDGGQEGQTGGVYAGSPQARQTNAPRTESTRGAPRGDISAGAAQPQHAAAQGPQIRGQGDSLTFQPFANLPAGITKPVNGPVELPSHLRRNAEVELMLSAPPERPIVNDKPLPAANIAAESLHLKLKLNRNKGGFIDPPTLREVADFGQRVFTKGMNYAQWVARMVGHLGEKIRPYLKAVWNSLAGSDFLPNSREGGGFGFAGGKSKVKPKGATAKGDTEFLRIEPGWKRLGRGLEFKGSADVLESTGNKAGRLLAQQIRRHVDLEQEIHGQLAAKIERSISGASRQSIDDAFAELEPYIAAQENGRPLPTVSPLAQKILQGWQDVAVESGKMISVNDVQVFDSNIGGYRPTNVIANGKYIPRMFKTEVERVLRDPDLNPALWNALVTEVANHHKISEAEAALSLQKEAGRFASNDFMGNLEMARTGQLPEIFYDYNLRNLASRYIPSFAERMAQIIAYGQRLGPKEQPLRPNLWDVARGEARDTETGTWLNAAEDQATNLRAQTSSGKGFSRLQTMASGLLLSSPTTSVMRNALSGITSTVELMGVARSIRVAGNTFRSASRENAREMGVVRQDIGDFLHVDKLGESFIDDAVRAVTDKMLRWSGYTGSEVIVRTHASLAASQFARDAVVALNKRPTSMRSKEALAMFKRMGVDAEKIVAEKGEWKNGPETRQFIRTVIRDSQGGYRFDQVPLWANGNMGRFFFQFGRWSTQRARNIWKNGIKPALGEEVQWKGKTMARRDLRPLLKMAGSTIVLGETFAQVASVFFDRDRKDASMSEIAHTWEEDKGHAFALAGERAINDIVMAGMLGIWGQPIDLVKTVKDQSRLKNPFEPPGVNSIKALTNLAGDAYDQNGRLTRKDLLNFAGTVTPGAKQLTDVARNVFDEPLYEAENDVRTLRGAAIRWARTDKSVSVALRKGPGDIHKSPMAPEYEPIKEALLTGNSDHAKVLAATFLAKQPDLKKAKKSLIASIKASQPFRVGPYTSEEHREDFQAWAKQNLSSEDFEQTERVQARYSKAAAAADLW